MRIDVNHKIALLGIALLAGCGPSPPSNWNIAVWEDPQTGCNYIITEQGFGQNRTFSMTIRFRNDGKADCPGNRMPEPNYGQVDK